MTSYSEVQKCKKMSKISISETVGDRAKRSEIWDHLVDDLQRSSKMSKNSPDDENGEMSHDPKIGTFRKFGPNTYLGNR